MIEILMCTYNGEKFIEKQLISLISQTKKADLVRIFDDMSTDATVEIINNFINKNSLKNWLLVLNDAKKGWRKNFYDAIKKSTGDIVFFCDQDDIWREDKIEIMSKVLVENNLLRLSGLQFIIDENDNIVFNDTIITCPKKYDMHVYKEKFNENIAALAWKNRIGCAMVLSKELVNMINFFEFDQEFAHDIWAVELSSFLGRGAVIEYPCINYRIHSNNATVGLKNNFKSIWEVKKYNSIQSITCFNYLFESITKMKEKFTKKQYKRMENILNMLKLRVKLLKNKSVFIWLKMLKYLKYYPNKKTYLADLIDILNLR